MTQTQHYYICPNTIISIQACIIYLASMPPTISMTYWQSSKPLAMELTFWLKDFINPTESIFPCSYMWTKLWSTLFPSLDWLWRTKFNQMGICVSSNIPNQWQFGSILTPLCQYSIAKPTEAHDDASLCAHQEFFHLWHRFGKNSHILTVGTSRCKCNSIKQCQPCPTKPSVGNIKSESHGGG